MAFVSASGSYLIDDRGERFLDAGISNALLGHGNRAVAEAVGRQMTGGDFGVDLRAQYIPKLLAKFPAAFTVCYLLHSTSEACELALRLARAHRPGKDAIVLEDADYGMTTSLANMSPARFQSRGGGKKFWVQVASRSDASDVAAKARAVESSGRGVCGFFAEGVFENDYLREAYASVASAGGLNIAIEGQTGMGRLGTAFWEFERHGVSPDIVVIGESMANGFPMAAVVTTPSLAAPFAINDGGGPVACAAAIAVLDAMPRVPQVDLDLRGSGLCWEIDVDDAAAVVARLHEKKVLIAARANTVLFRPPLTFTAADAARFVDALGACL
ncbi:MAG: aminotransferase class III-fold pyridoxal phosphate-dependent enzyme [Acidobacteriota bacterium]